ncbi:unnamed protein product [Brassica oleracea]|uniref:Uncharacterized protein n=1 Tax=Brassica oleracea TaxID=3712 RepID=A0A3P6ETT3_BRAOL|nr:unnamed protein product [Brassica oleracea]
MLEWPEVKRCKLCGEKCFICFTIALYVISLLIRRVPKIHHQMLMNINSALHQGKYLLIVMLVGWRVIGVLIHANNVIS